MRLTYAYTLLTKNHEFTKLPKREREREMKYLDTIRHVHRRKHQNCSLTVIYLQPPTLLRNLNNNTYIIMYQNTLTATLETFTCPIIVL